MEQYKYSIRFFFTLLLAFSLMANLSTVWSTELDNSYSSRLFRMISYAKANVSQACSGIARHKDTIIRIAGTAASLYLILNTLPTVLAQPLKSPCETGRHDSITGDFEDFIRNYDKRDLFHYRVHPDYEYDGTSTIFNNYLIHSDYVLPNQTFIARKDGLFDFSPLESSLHPVVILHSHGDTGIYYPETRYSTGYGGWNYNTMLAPHEGEIVSSDDDLLGYGVVRLLERGEVVHAKHPDVGTKEVSIVTPPVDHPDFRSLPAGLSIAVPKSTGRLLAMNIAESLRRARTRGFNIEPIQFIVSGCDLAAGAPSFIDLMMFSKDDKGEYILGLQDVVSAIAPTVTTIETIDLQAVLEIGQEIYARNLMHTFGIPDGTATVSELMMGLQVLYRTYNYNRIEIPFEDIRLSSYHIEDYDPDNGREWVIIKTEHREPYFGRIRRDGRCR